MADSSRLEAEYSPPEVHNNRAGIVHAYSPHTVFSVHLFTRSGALGLLANSLTTSFTRGIYPWDVYGACGLIQACQFEHANSSMPTEP